MLALVLILMAGCSEPASQDGAAVPAAEATGSEAVAQAETAPSPVFDRSTWAELATDPAAHKGARVDIVGQVFLPPEKDAEGIYFQMYADPRNMEWNTIVGYDDPGLVLSDDDFVRVTGWVDGAYTGENAFGAELTLPVITAEQVTVVDATAAASPALHTASDLPAQDQNQVSLTVDKVEFAADETRVFVTVANLSQAKASFYAFNAKAVQGDQQFEPELFGSPYPEVQSELLPGVKSSGILVFPPMDSGNETALYFEAGTDDWNQDFDPYVFIVPAS